MTTYRELVQRTVACRYADLELGLSRAREQEPFVIHVSDLLDKAGIEYAVRMDKDFQTTFYGNNNPEGNLPSKRSSENLESYFQIIFRLII